MTPITQKEVNAIHKDYCETAAWAEGLAEMYGWESTRAAIALDVAGLKWEAYKKAQARLEAYRAFCAAEQADIEATQFDASAAGQL